MLQIVRQHNVRGCRQGASSASRTHDARSGSVLALLLFIGLFAVVLGVAGLALTVARDAQSNLCPPGNQNCPDNPPP